MFFNENKINTQELLLNDRPSYLENFLEDCDSLVDWNSIEDCLNRPELFDFELIDTNNKQIEIPTHEKLWVWHKQVQEKSFLFEKINQGHTLVILNYSYYNRKTIEFLKKIETLFYVRSAIHIYCGIGNSCSFSIHEDFPANFIVQIEGKTRWKVFNNRCSTLFRLGTLNGMVENHAIDENILDLCIDVELSPGDALYIPSRCFHAAYPSEKRISMSIPCWSKFQNDSPNKSLDRTWYTLNNKTQNYIFKSRVV